FSTRKATGCSASSAGGVSSGGKVYRVAPIYWVFHPVDVWRRRVLRARTLSAVRTKAYSVIAVGGRRSFAEPSSLLFRRFSWNQLGQLAAMTSEPTLPGQPPAVTAKLA